MSAATLALVGDEVLCSVSGGPEARFPSADAAARLKAWAQRYDAASWRDAEGELAAIGVEMFAWLDSTNRWATAWLEGPGERVLEVRVDGRGTEAETALLDAPWELLVGPRGPLAADGLRLFVPYRRIGRAAPPPPAEVGDLRVMFMAASPGDAADLDFEAEEAAILDATARLPMQLTVEETGALAFLSERLSTEGPFEVLHLSCHGTIDAEAGPALVLEDAAGGQDLVGPDRIAGALGARAPALLFLSACRTAEHGRAQGGKALPGYRDEARPRDAGAAPLPAVPLARQLAEVAANVVGWDGSVYDADATAFARHFYGELAKTVTVQRAAGTARNHLLLEKAGSGAGRHWHLARVYVGAGGGGPLCDNGRPKRTRPAAPERAFLDEERRDVPVASRAEFVGRRRAVQALLRGYRDGSVGALIHGMGALGKSSLAARVVSRLPTLVPIVVFKRYDALAVFDRVADRLPPALRRGEVARWREQVGHDASALADALESWLAGPFAARPVLLIVDDLERVLETPRAGAAPVSVDPAFRPVVSAVLVAFGRAAGASRLLLTSRYDFRLLDGYGDDLAGPLVRVPLQAMTTPERNKQWRAARRPKGREGETSGRVRDLRVRALAAASGNPGLQATLTKPILSGLFDAAETAIGQIETFLRTGVPPAEIEAALKSGQAKDRDNAVVAFFRRVSFDAYRRALSDDQTRQMAAAAFFSPDVPIPVAALAAVGAALGVEEAEAAVARLIGLGLLDDFGEVDGYRHAALNPLARPLADIIDAANAPRLARAAVPGLVTAWRGDDGFPTDPRGLEAARLALIDGAEPVVLEDAVLSGAAWLERGQGQTRAAFDLIAAARDALPADHAYGPLFLRLTIECAGTVGDGASQEWAVSAHLRPCPPTDHRARGSYAALDLRRAETLRRKGDVPRAESLIREALGTFRDLGDARMSAIAFGQIADVLQARGEPDEALRIRREEELPVYERLGDVRSRTVTMGKIADVLQARGELDEALRIRREEQLPVFERLGDVRSRAVTMGKIANILQARGELDEALRIRREEQLPVFERFGDVRERAVTMGQVANVLQARGELDEALRIRREEQLPIFERLGDVRSRAVTMGQIADVLQARVELDEALRIRREEELPIFERLGDVRSRAVTMGKIADVLQARGELDEALRIHREEQLPVFERLGDVRSRAVTMGKIADVLQGRGELDEALRIRREEELPVYERLGDVRSRAMTMGQIADVLEVRGELDEALRIRREEELPIYERLGDVRSTSVTLHRLALSLIKHDGIAQGRGQEIYEALTEAFDIAVKLDNPDGIGAVGVQLAQILAIGQLTEVALNTLDQAEAAFTKLREAKSVQFCQRLRAQISHRDSPDEES